MLTHLARLYPSGYIPAERLFNIKDKETDRTGADDMMIMMISGGGHGTGLTDPVKERVRG